MKGGVTYKDMDERKRKAAAFDEALAYLESHADNEASTTAREILRRAIAHSLRDSGGL